MSNKTVLITGVSGQDGSLMAEYLLKNTGYEIRGMVRRTAKPDYTNLSAVLNNPRFQLVVGDLGDSQSIDNLVRELKPDYFINFAAQSFVGSSWQIPLQTIQAGTMGVVYCLEAIRNFAPQCRFYNAGSSEEFGDVITSPQNESHPLRPQSPYGAAKAASRHFVRVYRESYNLFAIQGILYNHEGTKRGAEFVTRKITKGVAEIVYALRKGDSFEPIELGNLNSKRDWSDAEDFMDGVWRMLNQTTPKEYVLSSNETHSIREFVEIAFYTAGLKGVWSGEGIDERYLLTIPIKNRDFINGILPELVLVNPKFYRPAEVNLLHGDSTLARTELGWAPKTSFKQLVQKMVENDLQLLGVEKYS